MESVCCASNRGFESRRHRQMTEGPHGVGPFSHLLSAVGFGEDQAERGPESRRHRHLSRPLEPVQPVSEEVDHGPEYERTDTD